MLTVRGSIESRDGRGGTATAAVTRQLAEIEEAIDAISAWVTSEAGSNA